jgi:hypothetical protein
METGQRLTLRARLKSLGPLAQSAFIALALLIGWLLLAPLAYSVSGMSGLQVSLLAGAICWLGAQFSLLISQLVRGEEVIFPRLVLGMTARAMVPLVLGTGLQLKNAQLASAGLIFYVLVFYMVTLAADTALLLSHTKQPLAPKKVH